MIRFSSTINPVVDAAQIGQLLTEIQQDPMGGWYDLPETYDRAELAAIKQAAAKIQSDSKYLVCIGIGGSYLGHRAVIEALAPVSANQDSGQPQGVTVLYAGNSLSPHALNQLLATLGDHDFSINVISKSGTTTEPAVAFRLLKAKLQAKYGQKAKDRIYATTDAARGALHDEAIEEGYTRFIVPDNIGGRYSVLTAVGLLPLAAAGIDIDALLEGAAAERADLSADLSTDLSTSAPAQYATLRASLLQENHDVEVLATFEPHFQMFTEWWKQLFGESEGKDGQGIFPASVVYTTDLHSLGQYLQDGRRNIFETFIEFADHSTSSDPVVPTLPEDLDGLKYLEGRPLSELNQKALEATIAAHRDGGIPVLELTAPDQSARSLGALIFFFEVACAISAKLSGVNPFDQPGVEAYKNNMFRLLGKPGYTN